MYEYDIFRLERLSVQATPGPWLSDKKDTCVAGPLIEGDWDWIAAPVSKDPNIDRLERGVRLEANCRYVAAVNPKSILFLCAHVRELHTLLEGVLTAPTPDLVNRAKAVVFAWNRKPS